MIRFLGKHIIELSDMDIAIASESILLGGEFFREENRKHFKQYVSDDATSLHMIPVTDERQEIICYAYQDREANRELRMLKELEKTEDALRFQDVYPKIQEVVIYGCNELAYYFVKYLEKQHISVKTSGKYWRYFGYKEDGEPEASESQRMAVLAEGTMLGGATLYQTLLRSVSPEFECIEKIYEANRSAGKIGDAKGNLEELLETLKEREVVLLGTDYKSQDAYDFLYEHGIDIACFAEWEDTEKGGKQRTLLGKDVVSVEGIIRSKEDAVWIDSIEKNSALGTEAVEIFDYYGYERNEQFFLLQDYTEIPCTSLLHVLKGKNVFFSGEERLCRLVMNYLKETGNIDSLYIELPQRNEIGEADILCVVNPCIHRGVYPLWSYPKAGTLFNYYDVFDINRLRKSYPKAEAFRKALEKYENPFYTEYFSQMQILVVADEYRNRGRKKYDIKKFCPKGFLLGKIPFHSGNIFFRGILDGHPDILKWSYSAINNNLLLYCIRLAGETAENILSDFKRICSEEIPFYYEHEFSSYDQFENRIKELLSVKESFTSQELFVIFHIAYMEVLFGYKIEDLSQKIIYWEPHFVSREDFCYVAQWLEDAEIHGQTVCLHRDNVTRNGAVFKVHSVTPSAYHFVPGMSAEKITSEEVTYENWEEFHMRFEDIKLHPQRELRALCDRVGIFWSDMMLRVTDQGKAVDYEGISDFDLNVVFNQYEEFLSAFDRFRISLLSSPYQKKYGYTYEDCMGFSRRELQEMFLKEFRFQTSLGFDSLQEERTYALRMQRLLRNLLWEARKHAIMDDVVPLFGAVEVGETTGKKQKKAKIAGWKEWDKLLRFVKEQEKLVLYGTGRDCEGLWERLGEEEKTRLVFGDLKAERMEVCFHDRNVIAPRELCGKYQDYPILITSSRFYEEMRRWLEFLGVAEERITCNIFQLWKEEA